MTRRTQIGTGSAKGQGIGNPLSKRLYTLKEAAVYLGRTEWGMRELIWSGQVPVIRNQGGRKIFVDLSDMDLYINRQKERYT